MTSIPVARLNLILYSLRKGENDEAWCLSEMIDLRSDPQAYIIKVSVDAVRKFIWGRERSFAGWWIGCRFRTLQVWQHKARFKIDQHSVVVVVAAAHC